MQPLSRKTIVAIVILIVLLCLALGIKSLILGNATFVTLSPGQTLTGVVSQSMATPTSNSLPVAGIDYRLSTQYFDGNTWAVGLISPINNNINSSVVVLEKLDNTYQVVLGPTSAMPSTQLQSMPSDVAGYVKAHVAIYQPVPDQ